MAYATLMFLIFMYLIQRSGFTITGFITSLNTVNSQVWAFLVLVAGGTMAVVFKRAGIAIDIAAGVIGVAANMFSSLVKPVTPGSQHVEIDSSATPPAVPPTLPALNGITIPKPVPPVTPEVLP